MILMKFNYNNSIEETYIYNPFGEMFPTECNETVSNPFKFSGQFFDDEISQYYLRARQYDPYIHRFTSRDLVDGKFDEPMTLHKYLYCTNDPINFVDPQGLWAFYATLTGQIQSIIGGIVQHGVVIDDNGNVGIITIASIGVGTPAVNFGTSFGYSWRARTMFDLAGEGWAAGGSFGAFGLEGFVGDNGIEGYEITIGMSLLPVPEGHLMRTNTMVTPTELNWIEAKGMIQERLEDAMYEVQTLGEGYGFLLMYGIMD